MIRGAEAEMIEAYSARPLGPGPYPSAVVLHHRPGGYDRESKDVAVRLANHGYQVLLPNLHYRAAPGAHHDEAAKIVIQAGGLPDDQVIGDASGAIDELRSSPASNGRVGVIGFCSGGREAFLVGCSDVGADAVVDCWGSQVAPNGPETDPLTERDIRFLSRGKDWAIERAKDLAVPLLGLFGAEDTNPTVHQVDRLRAVLEAAGKQFDFTIYPGAGHAFMAPERAVYRIDATVDAWRRILEFFHQYLGRAVDP